LINLIIIFTVLGTITAVHGHHVSITTFTRDRTTTVEGVITEFKFRNPHVLLYLDVIAEDGSVTNWMSEGHSATGWRRAGWKPDTLKIGDRVRITGDASIDGSPMVWLDRIEYLDKATGRVLAVLNSREDPNEAFGKAATVEENKLTFIPLKLPTGEPNFTGTTTQHGTFATRGGPDGNDMDMPYNDKGEKARAAWDIVNDPQVFCDPPGLIRQVGYTPYGQIIKQYPDHITIEYEEYGGRRAIFFDDELPKPGPRSHLGDSVARYEGDALIIETVNLYPNASGHRGKPLSDKARVTEVYTRVDGPEYGSAVRTDTTVVDPEYLTASWTITRTKVYSDGYEFIENECVPPLRERPHTTWQEQ
jgi:hypothetical protein